VIYVQIAAGNILLLIVSIEQTLKL
jgi:hypothetical protein